MEMIIHYGMLAIGIMFTPLSDDVLMITHLTVADAFVPGWLLFVSTWILFTLTFGWFYLIGKGLHHILPMRQRESRYLKRAEAFYQKYGARTIMISYFIPGLRHPLHYIAGFTSLKLRTYTLYTTISAFLYTSAWFLVIGLANQIPAFQQFQDWVLSF
ncbi:VTT domain-containing protein [Exiguobacterium sp. s160]|uniref:DedA family protein n=1 Tax=Exiguobacterium sp. s160 TaxID=2751265 RepID=UPI001BEB2763|nr:VTT domain-containing protein [Exiguobacterium sp. s160]